MAGRPSRPAHLRDLPVFLRAPRAAGLWLVGVLITLASVVAFGLSYRGLFLWALHHQWPPPWPAFFPLLIDVLIVVCEVILFVAAIDGDTPWHVRALAWVTLLAFTGLSVAGNAEHALRAGWQSRVGFALPPLVLAIALGFGLGELKRQAAKYRAAAETVSPAVPARVPLPPFAAIRDRRGCSQQTAKIVRAEVQLDRRSRGGLAALSPAPVAAPAGAPPEVPSPPAGALATMNGSHGA